MLQRIKEYYKLIKLIGMARHKIYDSRDTIIINVVFQSGMSWLLYCLKEKFKNIVIVGHPSTLRYCKQVFGKKDYRKCISWVRKLNYKKVNNAAIIADSNEKECDLFVDFDYYNTEKQKISEIFQYYQPPAKFYCATEKNDGLEKQKTPRKVAIFVCGAVPIHGYPLLAKGFPELMNRTEIVDAIWENFADDICELSEMQDRKSCPILMAVRDARKGDNNYLLNSEEFLDQMAMADFYVAAPGNGMPHCHNIIEAMSEGTIPITNYAAFMNPPLIDGETCLAFHDCESLNQAVRRALAMAENEVEIMKEKVREYYSDYCSKESVIEQLSSHFYRRQKKMLLLNDEGNTIQLQVERRNRLSGELK